jgi:hypothetical protein
MLRDEIKAISSSPRELRIFGFTVGGVFFALGILLLWKAHSAGPWLAGMGALLVCTGASFPRLLLPLQKIWMTLALLMGWVMTRVILSILFFLVVTPIGLVARMAGKRFMESPAEEGADSYWRRRSGPPLDRAGYEKQY